MRVGRGIIWVGTGVKQAVLLTLITIVAMTVILYPLTSTGGDLALDRLQIRPPPPPPPPPVKVAGFEYSIEEDKLVLRLQVILPNPCYKLESRDAHVEDGKIIANAVLTPPWPGTVCIQVIKAQTLHYEMPLPPPGEYPAYLRLYVNNLISPLPTAPVEIFLGTVEIPGNASAGETVSEKPLEPNRYQGLLLELVGEWEGAPGFWVYKARVQGLGEALVVLPLEISGGLPAGFTGAGYEEAREGSKVIVLAQATVFK